MQVSITTVTEAYRLLESQGLLEARPQSGYYVRFQLLGNVPPTTSIEQRQPTLVESADFIAEIVNGMAQSPIKLGAANPDPLLLPSKQLNRCLAKELKADENIGANYDVPPGCARLRIQIARRALLWGSALSPEDIVLTVGCQEALCLALRATCSPGDTVAIESPTFYGQLQAIEMMGLKVLEIPTNPCSGLSLEALRLALEQLPISALMVTPNHSNPSGSLMPEKRRWELLELTAPYDLPIIEDDVYGDLGFSQMRLPALKSLDRDERVLYCSSFSKTLSPGHRVGWIVPGRYYRDVLRCKILSNLASPGLPAQGIAHFLESGYYDRHLNKIRKECCRRSRDLRKAVLEYFPRDTQVSQPQGGFVLWVKLPPGLDALDLHNHALRQGISLAPGPIFSAQKNRYHDHIRLAASHPIANLAKSIQQLGTIVKRPLLKNTRRN